MEKLKKSPELGSLMPLRSVLKGIRILDLTMNLPGPMATQILGDFGADVIKIEPLTGDPVRYFPPFIGQESSYYLSLNRNKRSFAVDLKSEEGLEILYKLVAKCDIVLIGFLPSTVKKLKLDFETLIKKNSKLIYCHLTGYDDSEDKVGHDLNYIGESGILSITGPKSKPIVPGVPIADIGGGSLPTVITILAALFQKSDSAQYFNVSMVDHLIPWLSIVASEVIAGIGDPERELHPLSGFLPWYRIYQSKDNQYITFAALEQKFWQRFCNALDRDDLFDQQFNLALCDRELPLIFKQKTAAEWDSFFSEYNLPGGLIFTPKEALEKENRLTTIYHQGVGEIKTIASPYLHYSSESYQVPMLGQHTREILEELGLEREIERLIKAKIVHNGDLKGL
jgi:crotonobetainyl-CoA:carnitine CoA-transferase CaiB-like acyl-CoA transferase